MNYKKENILNEKVKCSDFSFDLGSSSVTCPFESQVFDFWKEGQITRVWFLTDVEAQGAWAGSAVVESR